MRNRCRAHAARYFAGRSRIRSRQSAASRPPRRRGCYGADVTSVFVKDELAYLDALVGIGGKRVLDIGCGEGEFARRLLKEAGAGTVVGIEVEPAKRVIALQAEPLPGLRFEQGVAESIPLADASVDAALMMKSLHHVPIAAMDAAFAEIHRVLAGSGLLYISEPVYAGELNEVMRLFHDEGVVRAAACEAIGRARDSGDWELLREEVIDMAMQFRDFDDFHHRMVERAGMSIPAGALAAVRERFERSMGAEGARFVRQLRVDLMRSRP